MSIVQENNSINILTIVALVAMTAVSLSTGIVLFETTSGPGVLLVGGLLSIATVLYITNEKPIGFVFLIVALMCLTAVVFAVEPYYSAIDFQRESPIDTQTLNEMNCTPVTNVNIPDGSVLCTP